MTKVIEAVRLLEYVRRKTKFVSMLFVYMYLYK